MADAARARRRRRAMLPGSARDRRFAFLKRALPLASLVLLALLVVLPLTGRQEFSFLLSRETAETARDRLAVEQARYSGETLDGERFELVARGARQRTSELRVVELEGLAARVARPDGVVGVTAPSGLFDLEQQLLTVAGPVRGGGEAGWRVEGGAIAIDLQRLMLRSDEPVAGRLPIGDFAASRFEADWEGRRVVLGGRARLVIRPGRA